ncbi:MAG TPA: mechanosensitive ion channel domain-containing protein [Terriglobales bacterium]|nr:mechanosensitive ion channel domain-containing protein [Terriglobales bacterium]
MAKGREKLAFIFLLLLVVAISIGIWLTGKTDQGPAPQRNSAMVPISKIIDQRPLQTAQALEKLTDTRDELRYVRNAQRAADDEVDLGFASALRDAKVHPPAETPATKQLRDRIRSLDDQVKDDQQAIKDLTAAAAAAKGDRAGELQDELQLRQAELALHEGQVEDAKLDLMRAGGDLQSRIQRAFNLHESTQHTDTNPAQAWLSKPESYQVPATLVGQVRAWKQLRGKQDQIDAARQQVDDLAADLDKKHDALEVHVTQLAQQDKAQRAQAGNQSSKEQNKATLALLQHESEDRKTLSEYDERIQDAQQVSQAYKDWLKLLSARSRTVIHGGLQSLLWIVLIAIAVVAGDLVVDQASAKLASERRRLATMRLLGHFVVQAVGLLLVLLVILGSPGQLSTIVAFAGAGLTVALKDFIVAFFGWFILMGKNGIRVGDWVEINGIGGEVVEISLLRTVLLETGNWADSGHPTGRRVTFVNSFAIEGHYFNFSTTGQWLWDSIEIDVPAGKNPHEVTEAITALITRETAENTQQAEHEWRRATSAYGGQSHSFSLAPAINVRPSGVGIRVMVRYIARAHERYEMKTRLYREIAELLHGAKSAAR